MSVGSVSMVPVEAKKIAVVLLNWNGRADSVACIQSLSEQTLEHTVIAVDNGSTDGFTVIVTQDNKDVVLLENKKNLGFAGGVNTGIRYAIDQGFDFVALINNDARPEPAWLAELMTQMQPNVGIVTGKMLQTDGTIDSTGECYSRWGLAFPRGRGEQDTGQYNTVEEVFGASGGASLYRIDMLRQTGLFDEDFFAYYEDVDVSFRARLYGWKVMYAPVAVVHHKIGATSGKIKGFTTYQTIKNVPWLYWKNMPLGLALKNLPRFTFVYAGIILSSLVKGRVIEVIKGIAMSSLLLPKKLLERRKIQKRKTITSSNLNSLMQKDLPPAVAKLGHFLRRSKSS